MSVTFHYTVRVRTSDEEAVVRRAVRSWHMDMYDEEYDASLREKRASLSHLRFLFEVRLRASSHHCVRVCALVCLVLCSVL
jgi:hypothetical protein